MNTRVLTDRRRWRFRDAERAHGAGARGRLSTWPSLPLLVTVLGVALLCLAVANWLG